mmetsp:Transcript_58392/g.94456  ORF Transcript_58392/g.94456 Transcript_58392/m.94456 type:complete len:255 (+) Transcript_58392:1060-1824(+)
MSADCFTLISVRMASLFSGSLSSMTPVAMPPIMKPDGPVLGSSYLSRMSAPCFVGSYASCFLTASFCLCLSESSMFTLDSSSCPSIRLPSLSSKRWSLRVMMTVSPSLRSDASWLTLIFGTLSDVAGASFLFLVSWALTFSPAPFMEPSVPRVLAIQSDAPPFSSLARMSPSPWPVVSSSWSLRDLAAATFFFLSASDTSFLASAGAWTGSLSVPALPFAAFGSRGLMPSLARSTLLSSTLWAMSPPAFGAMVP